MVYIRPVSSKGLDAVVDEERHKTIQVLLFLLFKLFLESPHGRCCKCTP